MRQTVAFALAVTVAAALISQPVMGAASQGAGSISGTAEKEAKKPFPNYSVRARNVVAGTIGASVPLDPQGNFALTGIDQAKFLVELLDPKGKVVCTEGPFDLTTQATKTGVDIRCGNPAAWWLLAAAGAAGVTAGIVANGPASPAR
jgi:hypothetical protein